MRGVSNKHCLLPFFHSSKDADILAKEEDLDQTLFTVHQMRILSFGDHNYSVYIGTQQPVYLF